MLPISPTVVSFFSLFALVCSYHPPVTVDGAEVDAEEKAYAGTSPHWVASWSRPIDVPKTKLTGLKTFCWPGVPRNIWKLLYSAYFYLEIENEAFHLYKGSSSEEVTKQYKSMSQWFGLLPWRDRKVKLNPFSPTCLGVSTSQAYKVALKIFPIDPYRLIGFIAGVCLILGGRRMSRNSFFHYSSGISIALVGSLLVLIYVVSRMIPRRAAGISFLVGGWAVVLYFIQTLWKNFRETVLKHSGYVTIYVVTVSVLTFLVIYRIGGVKNPRTMDILQWLLQFGGAALIYLSCNIEIIAIAIICLLVALELFLESGYSLRGHRFFNRFFPPRPRRLLTQDEYEEIGKRETIKELQKLRQFARSPECKTWQVVKKLRDPARFGSFVEDGTHLSMDEIDAHDRELTMDGEDDEYPQFDSSPSYNGPPSLLTSSGERRQPANSSRRLAGGGAFSPTVSPWRRSPRTFKSRNEEPMDYD